MKSTMNRLRVLVVLSKLVCVVTSAKLCNVQVALPGFTMDYTFNECDGCDSGTQLLSLQHEPIDGAKFERKYNFRYCAKTSDVIDVESSLVMNKKAV